MTGVCNRCVIEDKRKHGDSDDSSHDQDCCIFGDPLDTDPSSIAPYILHMTSSLVVFQRLFMCMWTESLALPKLEIHFQHYPPSIRQDADICANVGLEIKILVHFYPANPKA